MPEQGQERYEVYCIACGNTLSLAVSDRERALVEALERLIASAEDLGNRWLQDDAAKARAALDRVQVKPA